MANILLYIPGLNKEWGGIFHYSTCLLKILSKSDHKIYLYINSIDIDEEILTTIKTSTNLFILEQINVDEETKFCITARKMLAVFTDKILKICKSPFRVKCVKVVNRLDDIIVKYHINIIHCPWQNIGHSSLGIPSITTMHDVQELHYPAFFTSDQRMHRAVHHKNAIDQSDAVIVSFNHVKEDIIKFFAKPENQVHVCLLDMQSLWFEKFSKKKLVPLEIYNLPSHYILYPAATWEHKNHLKLIETIFYLKNKKNIIINVVCTSTKTNFYDTIQKKIEDLGIQQQFKFLGIVPDNVLFALYCNTTAVVIPTLYEAGSFPLIEAILTQIPVVCSNVTSLPETIGNAEFIFDPNNILDMSEKISKIMYDKDYRERNIQNSITMTEKIKSNNALVVLNNIYRNLLECRQNDFYLSTNL